MTEHEALTWVWQHAPVTDHGELLVLLAIAGGARSIDDIAHRCRTAVWHAEAVIATLHDRGIVDRHGHLIAGDHATSS